MFNGQSQEQENKTMFVKNRLYFSEIMKLYKIKMCNSIKLQSVNAIELK